MKKLLGLLVAVMLFVVAGASAKCSGNCESTWIKLSLWPPLTVPCCDTVHGLDLSLVSSIVKETQGVQFSFVYAKTNEKMVGFQEGIVALSGSMTGVSGGVYDKVDGKATGWQSGIVAISGKVTGLQSGFYCKTDDVCGVQYGFVNNAKSVSGVQLGIVNITENMNGIQVGIANFIKNSKLPFMIIANAKFK